MTAIWFRLIGSSPAGPSTRHAGSRRLAASRYRTPCERPMRPTSSDGWVRFHVSDAALYQAAPVVVDAPSHSAFLLGAGARQAVSPYTVDRAREIEAPIAFPSLLPLRGREGNAMELAKLRLSSGAKVLYIGGAFRVGSTPTPTCLPGQGGSRKRMWLLREQPSG